MEEVISTLEIITSNFSSEEIIKMEKFNEVKINIISAFTGEEIGSLIVDKDSKINEWFNNFIRNKYDVELKESDIKIMMDSIEIYSYYDQSIGNGQYAVLFNFIKEKHDEIHEINVSLLFSPTFIYISKIQVNQNEIIYHTNSYKNLDYLRQLKINKLINYLHYGVYNNSLSDSIIFNGLYNNIIITRFIFIILLKKNYDFGYLLEKQDESVYNNKEITDVTFSSKELSNDIEIVKIALSYDNSIISPLEYASIELRGNFEIVKIAVSNCGCALQYASIELRNNFEIVTIAVSNCGIALQYASIELRDNFEIVKIAVSYYGCSLEFASTEIRNNKEIVKIAVLDDSYALEFASTELRDSREIVKIVAMDSNRTALTFASKNLQLDKEIIHIIMKIVLSKNSGALSCESSEIRSNYDIVKLAVSNYGIALKYASTELRDNYKIVKIAVSNDGNALEYASTEFRNDYEIVKIAVSNNGSALKYASIDLQINREIIKIATNKDNLDDDLDFILEWNYMIDQLNNV
jgi:hypothetical protein